MITGMNHITLAVCDINRSFVFYRNVLGLIPLVKWDKGAYFLVGSSNNTEVGSGFWFCLNVDENHQPKTGYTHYAFSVSSAHFRELSHKIMTSGAVVFKDNTSPGDSLYFLDPDGHQLEIHVGNVEARIMAKKMDAGKWNKVEWFL